MLLKLSVHENHLEDFLNTPPGPHPHSCPFSRYCGRAWKCAYLVATIPSNTDTAGIQSTLWVPEFQRHSECQGEEGTIMSIGQIGLLLIVYGVIMLITLCHAVCAHMCFKGISEHIAHAEAWRTEATWHVQGHGVCVTGAKGTWLARGITVAAGNRAANQLTR